MPHTRMSARSLGIVAVICFAVASCSKPPPPPPPAPPPPPPPPAPLERDEVARRLADTYSMIMNLAFTPADEIVGSRQSILGGGATASRPAPPPSFKRWLERRAAWDKLPVPPTAPTAVIRKAWRDGILATYVAESRKLARDGNYHGANVLVSDASRLMARDDSENEPLKRFFRDVATRQSTESCSQSVNRFIQRHRQQAVLDLTHASILQQAKYKTAANYSAQRVEASTRLILLPLVARCRSYAESYAFRMPNIDEDSLRYLEKLVDRIGVHDRRRPGDPDMFAAATLDTDSVEYRECLTAIRAARAAPDAADDLEAEVPAGDAAARSKRGLTELVDRIRDTRRSFRQWLEDRRILFEVFHFFAGSNLEQDGGFGTSLPQMYAQDEFQSMTPLILDERRAASLLAWVSGGGAGRPDDVPVDVAFATLGWYFMDTQRPSLAQRAFLEGAYASLTNQDGDTLDSLAIELNGYRLLLTATALTAAPAGAPLPNPSTLDEVDILLAAWRSKWIRLGGSPQIADQQINEFSIQSSFKKRRLAELGRQAVQDRYFFDDYMFPDGSIPSVVIDALMNAPLVQIHDPSAFETAGYAALDGYFREARLPLKVDDALLGLWPVER